MISQEKVAGEPVSRILSPDRPRKQPYRGGDHSSDAAYPGVVVPTNRNKGPGRSLPCRSGAPPLFGLAPRGVCQPSRSLGTRWALTPPFHPCRGASSRRLAATRPLLDRSLVAVCSLWRCPSPRDVALGASSWRRPFGDAFGSALPSGVRTFLPDTAACAAYRGDHPAHPPVGIIALMQGSCQMRGRPQRGAGCATKIEIRKSKTANLAKETQRVSSFFAGHQSTDTDHFTSLAKADSSSNSTPRASALAFLEPGSAPTTR